MRLSEKYGVGALSVCLSRILLSSKKNTSTLNFLNGANLMATPIGEKIRAGRKKLKLTLEQLAEKSDSSKSYIWELENRPVVRPSAEKIAKIAEVLGVTVEFLIDDGKQSPTDSDLDQAFFRRVVQLDPTKRAQLEKFLKAIDDE